MTSPLKITFAGHATLLLEMQGLRLLTDPILRNRVAHLTRKAPPVDPAVYQNLDALLITHVHWDHLDHGSLKRIDKNVHCIVPGGAGELMEKFGFKDVEEIETDGSTNVGPINIKATFARHVGWRPPFGPMAESVGYIFDDGKYRTYFAGDTDLFPEYEKIIDAGELDLALLPVWGWGPTLGRFHMDPTQAAQAAALLKPRWAIPVHWGTFVPIGMAWLNPHFYAGTAQEFAELMEETAPEVEVHILKPGEDIELRRNSNGIKGN